MIAGNEEHPDPKRGPERDPRLVPYEAYASSKRRSRPAPAERAPQAAAQGHAPDESRAFEPEYYERIRRRLEALMADQPEPGAEPDGSPSPATGVTDELTDHNYDGIQEYDNPTPGWWHALFIGSVVFSVLYVFIYHMSTIVPPLNERHRTAEAIMLQEQFAELNEIDSTKEKVARIMQRDAWLERGAAIFAGTCTVCHGEQGNGLIGPNLTDEKYMNVASLTEIADLIRTGTPNGAMPAQKNLLNENEIALVAAYAASLRGKNLPTADTVAEQYRTGRTIPPWPSASESADDPDPAGDAQQAAAGG